MDLGVSSRITVKSDGLSAGGSDVVSVKTRSAMLSMRKEDEKTNQGGRRNVRLKEEENAAEKIWRMRECEESETWIQYSENTQKSNHGN